MLRHRIPRRFFSVTPTSESVPAKTGKYFDKILIANRGEISCRVTRSAHKLGIKTVAIYSDPDIQALHVRTADEAICVGPAQSSKSYLNVARILDAIKKSGAQAVHPGYGFLSENASFAKVLEDRGIKFIGPRSHSIEAMGDKIESKTLAKKAGVSTIPGYLGTVADDNEAIKIARQIGYPVMIKASSGGGGKGMRIAWNDDEVRLGYRLSKEEAKNSFGSDRLFVEKFIEDPRHIEIQLIADSHGNVVALPERECSIQRRNQKVIEESPSVLLDEKTRHAMQDQACALARAVGYESAGTVEFLADKNRNFYFLEMNTRLQVEHPVTEAVTGLDLVELMIRVAAGEKLPTSITGARVPIKGHAFESRVYAEDPFRGFLPSTGRLSKYIEPATFAQKGDAYMQGPGLRADAGVTEGSEISMFYDPMICKLVTHAKTRDAALDRMRAALDDYVIRGVGHNVPLLRDLVDHPRFISGKITTQFIREEYPDGFKGVVLAPESKMHMAAVAAIMNSVRQMTLSEITGRMPGALVPNEECSNVIVTLGNEHHPNATVGDAANSSAREAYAVQLEVNRVKVGEGQKKNEGMEMEDGDAVTSSVAEGEEEEEHVHTYEWTCHITPHYQTATASHHAAGTLTTTSTTTPASVPVVLKLRGVEWVPDSPILFATHVSGPIPASHEGWKSAELLRVQHIARIPDGFKLQYLGATEDVRVRTLRAHALAVHMKPKPKRDYSKVVASPMPGTLVSLAVAPGDSVEVGQEVCVVEAMKMQNVLRSTRKGVIKSVLHKTGAILAVDQVIVEFAD